jgi:hypothetical protein
MNTEDDTKQGDRFHANLYRAELSNSRLGDPTIKIVANSPGSRASHERQIAAAVYEVAAALERGSDELKARWPISAYALPGQLVVELSEGDSRSKAEQLSHRVLAELSIPVVNPQ